MYFKESAWQGQTDFVLWSWILKRLLEEIFND